MRCWRVSVLQSRFVMDLSAVYPLRFLGHLSSQPIARWKSKAWKSPYNPSIEWIHQVKEEIVSLDTLSGDIVDLLDLSQSRHVCLKSLHLNAQTYYLSYFVEGFCFVLCWSPLTWKCSNCVNIVLLFIYFVCLFPNDSKPFLKWLKLKSFNHIHQTLCKQHEGSDIWVSR